MLHKLEEDCRSLLDAKFPEYFHFRHNHLDLLIGADKHWRLDTLENLELIGMASFGVVKSLNYINHNIEKIQRSDRDQRFKNIYFHFGLVFDCVNNLARNIALTSDYLGLKKINREPKGDEELVKKFKKWVSKEYSKKLASSIQNGGAVVFIPHQIDFLHGLVSSKPLMTEHSNFAKSVNKYRNFLFIRREWMLFNAVNLFSLLKERKCRKQEVGRNYVLQLRKIIRKCL